MMGQAQGVTIKATRPVARCMGDAVMEIIVAKALIRGKPEIRAVAPAEVKVRPGQTIRLKLIYEFEEAASKKETYRFELESRLGTRDAPLASAEFGDRWGLPDAGFGFVEQDHRVEQSSEHDLSFSARARYGVSEWGGDPQAMPVVETVTGKIRVRLA